MQTVYIGNTLINDFRLGEIIVDDVFQSNFLSIDWLAIGGGGGAGNSNTAAEFGGGGGAGRWVTGSASLTPQTINIKIGGPGNGAVSTFPGDGNPGQNTTLFINNQPITASGGGNGGFHTSAGGNGGSGGGGGSNGDRAGGLAVASTPFAGFGFNGASGSINGGGGGGAGSAGSGQFGGTVRAWLDGITYAQGGNGLGGQKASVSGSGGNGANNANAGSGGSGIVIIRYAGSGSKATGGNISFTSGYTYHTFTSASIDGTADFTFTYS